MAHSRYGQHSGMAGYNDLPASTWEHPCQEIQKPVEKAGQARDLTSMIHWVLERGSLWGCPGHLRFGVGLPWQQALPDPLRLCTGSAAFDSSGHRVWEQHTSCPPRQGRGSVWQQTCSLNVVNPHEGTAEKKIAGYNSLAPSTKVCACRVPGTWWRQLGSKRMVEGCGEAETNQGCKWGACDKS